MKRNPIATLVFISVVVLLILVVSSQLGLSFNTEACFETPPEGGLGGGYDCIQ